MCVRVRVRVCVCVCLARSGRKFERAINATAAGSSLAYICRTWDCGYSQQLQERKKTTTEVRPLGQQPRDCDRTADVSPFFVHAGCCS